MNMDNFLPKQKIPKDGFGPRGAPDCYYTSRVLTSTFRYVKFVRKLRALEEEQRKGVVNKLKDMKDTQICSFFVRSDRKSLINDVARRVDLCMSSFQEDLKNKRNRLKELYNEEERRDIRAFVSQVQEGAEAAWRDKQQRLLYLIDKRKKEHEDRYKATPLSKSSHALSLVYKLREKEAEEIQLYQMKEKEARKMAEKELDQMWHEVAMSEAAALAARMEYDEIERKRKDDEITRYTEKTIEEKKRRQEKEREMLKQETLRMKAQWADDVRKEEEAAALHRQKEMEEGKERVKFFEERKISLEEKANNEREITEMWETLSKGYLKEAEVAERIQKQKLMDTNECNKELSELRKKYKQEQAEVAPELLAEDARKFQESVDAKRCKYLTWRQNTNREVRQAMLDQIKDHKDAREELKKKVLEEDEYQRQAHGQLLQLSAHKDSVEEQARQKRLQDILDQMEYTRVLKERALQEERDQIKKGQIATREYEEDIKRMLDRPSFSDEVHPFRKPMMRGMKMAEKCPCSKPDYC